MKPFTQPKYLLLFLILLGSISRLIYGVNNTPWTLAPDQIAWEIVLSNVLEEGNLSYSRFIHYPHEGGTILISTLALLIKPIFSAHSLLIVGFLLDIVVRFIQLFVTQKVFGNRTAILLGLWLILPSPILIPWANLNFGLHYLSSVFPFILLLLTNKEFSARKNISIWTGLFLGFSIWFSYSNIVLVPITIIFLGLSKTSIKNWLQLALSFTSIIFSHICVRTFFDAGFHLSFFEDFSIRGITYSFAVGEIFNRFYHMWVEVFPNTTIVIGSFDFEHHIITYSWIAIVSIAILAPFLNKLKSIPQQYWVTLGIFSTFFIFYALGPFFPGYEHTGNHITYRHITYILPLLGLIVISGVQNTKLATLLTGLFILTSAIGSSELYRIEPSKGDTTLAAGWVLGTKFGHNTNDLVSIIESSQQNKKELIKGAGWGISASLFQSSQNEKGSIESKITELKSIYDQIPEKYQNQFKKGIEFSFEDFITPRLDKTIWKEKLEKEL